MLTLATLDSAANNARQRDLLRARAIRAARDYNHFMTSRTLRQLRNSGWHDDCFWRDARNLLDRVGIPNGMNRVKGVHETYNELRVTYDLR